MITTDLIEGSLTERWSELLREGERFEAQAVRRDDGSFRGVLRLEAPDGTCVEFEGTAEPSIGRTGDDLELFVWDALDAVLGAYLEEGRDERLTGVEELCQFEGRPLVIRVGRRNRVLEAEADRLLATNALI